MTHQPQERLRRWEWRRRMSLALGICSVMGAAACADAPMPVEPSPSAAALGKSAERSTGGGMVEVVCAISYATDGGPYAYQYGRITVKLPAARRVADGGTEQYRFRNHAGKSVVGAANCTIPSTEQARSQMDRFFGARERGGRRAEKNGGARLLADNTYTIPITVNACQYGGDYPYCNPKPIEWDNSRAPKEYQICYLDCGNGDVGGGGDSPEPPAEPEECDPSLDPNCEKPLGEPDKQAIQTALDRHMRDPSTIADPNAREQCAAMGSKFRSMLAGGQVFRGATDTQTGDPGVDPHFGAYDASTGHLHFDPSYLDLAVNGDSATLREIANTALHEAAHALGFDHGPGYNNPFGPGLIYSEDYFKWLSPGTNSCVQNW